MTETGETEGGHPLARTGPLERLAAARWVLTIAAVLLLLLAALGRLEWFEALLVIGTVAAAAMLPIRKSAPETSRPLVLDPYTPPGIDSQLAAVIGALPEPALLMDSRATILACNEAAVAMFGSVRRGEPISLTIRAPAVIEAVRSATTDGMARSVEFSERVPIERSFEAHVVPIAFSSAASDASSGLDVILAIFRDLSQQRRVERMRADFVANASHELRTPLASLSGFIETLQGPAREDPTARERFLGIMVEQTRRMSRLIDDLLSLSRVELNQHLQPEEVVGLGVIVGHVCDTLAPLARERGVDLDISLADAPLLVRGERDELIRLFENLIENALKYGASGKRVQVSAGMEQSESGQDAVVTVRDFGPGIAAEHLPRLTERFYRVDLETSRAEGGTGLGLAIVKHILARHRGRLVIESEPGQGAVFSVHIPLVSPEQENPADTAA